MKQAMVILTVLGLMTTACATTRSNRRTTFTMQPITELAVGTLKLDGTAEAVTKEQASQLLPMWEVYKQIVSSDTSAQQEIDGLSEQITQTMTDAQRQSITAMKISEQDVFAVLQQGQGGASGQVARVNRSNGSSQPGGANNFFFGGGGGGGGGGFVPGGGFPGGGTSNPNSQNGGGANGSTARTSTQRLTQPARPQVPAPVLNAVIAYLKAKAG